MQIFREIREVTIDCRKKKITNINRQNNIIKCLVFFTTLTLMSCGLNKQTKHVENVKVVSVNPGHFISESLVGEIKIEPNTSKNYSRTMNQQNYS